MTSTQNLMGQLRCFEKRQFFPQKNILIPLLSTFVEVTTISWWRKLGPFDYDQDPVYWGVDAVMEKESRLFM